MEMHEEEIIAEAVAAMEANEKNPENSSTQSSARETTTAEAAPTETNNTESDGTAAEGGQTAADSAEAIPPTIAEGEAGGTDKPKGRLRAWASAKTAGGWVKFGLKCVGALLAVLCVSAVVYFNFLLNKIDYKEVDEFHQYYNLSDTDYIEQNEVYEIPLYYDESTTLEGFDPSMIDISEEDVLNIMLVGTDLRSNSYNGTGNTDSMVLLSVNTRDKNIKLTSFMRDMYVSIPERGDNRLNAAYSYGGPQLLFDTLKENFNVDVDKYIRVNFSNFKSIIDTVGGVDIELTYAEAEYMNKYAWKYKTNPVQPGLQRLDGAQALSYARCRKIDSDFKRTERQRKVILSFVDEVKHKNVAELNSLLNITLPMIQTNLTKAEIVSLLADSGSYMNNRIETLNIPIKNSYKPKTISGKSVICPNFDLNNMAILAHIYSTYQLDVSSTVYQEFDTPGGDNEVYHDEDGNTYFNEETGELYTYRDYPLSDTYRPNTTTTANTADDDYYYNDED